MSEESTARKSVSTCGRRGGDTRDTNIQICRGFIEKLEAVQLRAIVQNRTAHSSSWRRLLVSLHRTKDLGRRNTHIPRVEVSVPLYSRKQRLSRGGCCEAQLAESCCICYPDVASLFERPRPSSKRRRPFGALPLLPRLPMKTGLCRSLWCRELRVYEAAEKTLELFLLRTYVRRT